MEECYALTSQNPMRNGVRFWFWGLPVVLLLSSCELPTRTPSAVAVRLTAAEQTARQAFAPDLTVVERASVRLEVDGTTVSSAEVMVGPGQRDISFELDIPSAAADFVGEVSSNNGTLLFEGTTGPVEPLEGEIVDVELGAVNSVTGVAPDTLAVRMTRVPSPAFVARLSGAGLVRIGNFGTGRTTWRIGSVTPGGDLCTANNIRQQVCDIALFDGRGNLNGSGFVAPNLPDSLFVVLFDEAIDYDVELITPEGNLTVLVRGDSLAGSQNPRTHASGSTR